MPIDKYLQKQLIDCLRNLKGAYKARAEAISQIESAKTVPSSRLYSKNDQDVLGFFERFINENPELDDPVNREENNKVMKELAEKLRPTDKPSPRSTKR